MALAVAVTLLAPATTAPPAAAAAAAGAAPGTTAGTGVSLPGLRASSYRITLLTGDVVTLTADTGGRYNLAASAAARLDGTRPAIQISTEGRGTNLYAIPDDVRPHIAAGLLDKELFNVGYLAANGYDDQSSGELPVIVEYAGPQPAAARATGAEGLPASTRTRTLESLGGVGMNISKGGTASFWAAVGGRGDGPAARAAAADAPALGGGVAKIWLDRKATVTLEQSVPQIGTAAAWAAGLDGSGVRIAVLDTGIDADHPDVAGQIAAAQSFVPGESVADGHGHGTHVAATAAGTGAGSAGRFRGVAPGADLVVGKVLSNGGFGLDSWIIDGMEWATLEQGADIVSMSLGGGPSDGTDPLSQAVNDLAGATGALFVIAAGNSGPDPRTVAAPGTATAALTVGAVDKADALAGFSGRGPRPANSAIKPEVTAPGVAITAARAAGTAMGTPVDDRYTTANGTSMATPHVAGAAAVLAQRHPNWSADQLKSTLVATAEDGGFSVYEQGAGRVDIARAVRQQATVHPATADFGFMPWPHDGPPVTRTLTYTNPTDRPLTLDLAVTARGVNGAALPDGALGLDASTVTMPAAGSATVTVRLNRSAVGPGLYTGSVVATGPDGTRLRTPVGFELDHQRHKVTVEVVPRKDATQCPPAAASQCAGVEAVSVFAVDGPEAGQGSFTGTEFTATAGTYDLVVIAWWFHGHQRQTAFLMAPEVTVAGDTRVVIDANHAKRIAFDTPQPTEVLAAAFQYSRSTADRSIWRYLFSVRFQLDYNFWVTPTRPVTKGDNLVNPQFLLGAPPVSISVTKPRRHELHPQMFQYNVEAGAYQFWSGTRTLQVVDVGEGLAADYAGIDARGKLVLVHQIPGWAFGCALREDQLHQAIAAGAAAVLFAGVHMEQQYCGFPVFWSGDFSNLPPIPYAALPAEDTDLLTGLLKGGKPVTLAVTGNPDTPYLYTMSPHWRGHVPSSVHARIDHKDTAILENHLHAERPGRFTLSSAIYRQGDGQQLTVSPGFVVSGPRRLTEYVWPVDSTVFDQRTLLGGVLGVGEITFSESVATVLREPGRQTTRWHTRPDSMGAIRQPPEATAAGYVSACAGCRQGDTFYPTVYLTNATVDHYTGIRTTVGDAVKLYRDGQLLPQGDLLGVFSAYTLPPERARYRLIWDHDGIHTDWRFTSGAVTEDRTPAGHACWETALGISTKPCRPEPLIFLNYDAGVDLDNTVAPGKHQIRVRAGHQAPDAPRIAGVRLWISTDGGTRWSEVALDRARDGSFLGRTSYSKSRHHPKQVSLRAEAWDTAGNRVHQTIDHAYTVRASTRQTGHSVDVVAE